jgi:hypothetical protein
MYFDRQRKEYFVRENETDVRCGRCGSTRWSPLDDDGERCKRCGALVGGVWQTSDETWAKVSGEHVILCRHCFEVLADENGDTPYWEVELGRFPSETGFLALTEAFLNRLREFVPEKKDCRHALMIIDGKLAVATHSENGWNTTFFDPVDYNLSPADLAVEVRTALEILSGE